MYAIAFDLVVVDTEKHHPHGVSRAWFPSSVRDIRAFRIEQWPDFTAVIKEGKGT